LELSDVSFTYQQGASGETKALDRVSLNISTGECISVLGPPGSGKSTLLQMFNGLLRPDEGTVLLDGRRPGTDELPVEKACRSVGLVFQFPEYQLFEATIEAEVGFGPKNLGFTKDEIIVSVKDALATVGLDPHEYLDRSPFALSGGEMRRVAIASTIAMDCDMFAFDEPLSGLDPHGRMLMVELMKGLKDSGHTQVIVTHDVDEISQIAERYIVMSSGSVVFDGTASELFVDGTGLGVSRPSAAILTECLRNQGIPLPADIWTFDKLAEQLIELNRRPS
jgi:energy-coupling factor transport system ATP-binding protein